MFFNPWIADSFLKCKGFVLLSLMLFCFCLSFSQVEPLRIKYNFIIDDAPDRLGAKVVIEKDGKRWRQKEGSDLKGFVDLDYQHEYVLSFSKPGFITKKIAVSTKVPKQLVQDGFEPIPFDI